MEQNRKIALAQEALRENAAAVEGYLDTLYRGGGRCDKTLDEAARYSLMAGGKRVRPTLVLEFCRMLGGDVQAALPFGAAVEMIHTFSLIHDDLPCMDDDDLRRGRPTNHKVYGEATALLAGDGMVIDAFGVAAGNTLVPPEARACAVCLLSEAAGCAGMVRGQIMDMFGESNHLSEEELRTLHRHKTGALIRVSAQLGCLAAGYGPHTPEALAAVTYAENIGLAFQVIDDVLDATSTPEALGKSVGGDAVHGKNTYLKFYSVREAEDYAARLTREALAALSGFDSTERLCAIGEYLAVRKS